MGDRNQIIDIRPMQRNDIAAVAEMEQSTNPSPWTPEQFQAELKNPASRIDLLLVDGELASFICSWSIVDELQIQNIATAPAFRRSGYAVSLLQYVLQRASREGGSKVFLEVRIGNAAAIALYEKLGFFNAGIRKNYYADNEDALLMALELMKLET